MPHHRCTITTSLATQQANRTSPPHRQECQLLQAAKHPGRAKLVVGAGKKLVKLTGLKGAVGGRQQHHPEGGSPRATTPEPGSDKGGWSRSPRCSMVVVVVGSSKSRLHGRVPVYRITREAHS